MLRSIVKPKVSHLLKKCLASSTLSGNGCAPKEPNSEDQKILKSIEAFSALDTFCKSRANSINHNDFSCEYKKSEECEGCVGYQSRIKDLSLEIKKLEHNIETLKASYSTLEKMYEECKSQLSLLEDLT